MRTSMAAMAAAVAGLAVSGCAGSAPTTAAVSSDEGADDRSTCAYAREGALELAKQYEHDGQPVLVSLTGVDESSRRALPGSQLGFRCEGDAVYSNNTSGRVEFGMKYLEDGSYSYYQPLQK